VAPRHRGKHLVDQRLLFTKRHGAVAEMGGAVGRHGVNGIAVRRPDHSAPGAGRLQTLASRGSRRVTMPELPEVETVRRGLQPALEGARFEQVLARRPDLRWPLPKDFVQRLEGKTVEGLGRRAKYLLADLSSGEVLLMHLGMSGSFRVFHDGRKRNACRFHHDRQDIRAQHPTVLARWSARSVTSTAPRRFGFMKLVQRASTDQDPLLRSLGPEPLGNAFDAAMLAQACRCKKTSLKAALSDQRVV